MHGQPDPEMRARIATVVAEVFDAEVDGFDPSRSIRSFPAWDSVSHLRLVLELEDRFGIAIGDEEAAGMATLGDIAAIVRSHTTG